VIDRVLDSTRALLKRAVPRRYHAAATRALLRTASIALRGDRVECPCCGRRFRRFLRYPSLFCPGCGTYERHRALCLLLDAEPDLVAPPLRLLHVAPEPALERRLRRPGVDYVSIDLEYPLAMYRMDLTQMTFEDESFDVVLCLHVFETPEAARAGLPELFRVTRAGGRAIVSVPSHLDAADPDVASLLERIGFEVRSRQLGRELGEERCARHGLERDAVVHLCRRPALSAGA
jgi:SAM-dependent methyltransferase